jgi:hypothetical protein
MSVKIAGHEGYIAKFYVESPKMVFKQKSHRTIDCGSQGHYCAETSYMGSNQESIDSAMEDFTASVGVVAPRLLYDKVLRHMRDLRTILTNFGTHVSLATRYDFFPEEQKHPVRYGLTFCVSLSIRRTSGYVVDHTIERFRNSP